jgi:hypothetical protein
MKMIGLPVLGSFSGLVWSNLGATIRGSERNCINEGVDVANDEGKAKR